MAALEFEECFRGYPGWVNDSAWGYFTPREQVVLTRWRRMHDGALARQWKTAQADRDNRPWRVPELKNLKP